MSTPLDDGREGLAAPPGNARPAAPRKARAKDRAGDARPGRASGTFHPLEWTQWRFLAQQFRNMPLWVRVLTYLVVLTIVSYDSLLPTALSGTLLQRDAQGRVSENHKITYVAVWFEGPPLKLKVEGSGWRVPVINRAPWKAQHVGFFDADDRMVYDIEPLVTALLFSKGEYRLIFDETTNRMQEASSGAAPGVRGVLERLGDLVPSAYAQTPAQVQVQVQVQTAPQILAQTPVAPANSDVASDCSDACRTIALAANVPSATVHAGTALDSLVPDASLPAFRRSLARRLSADPRQLDWARLRTVDDFERFSSTYRAAGHITGEVRALLAAVAADNSDLRTRFEEGSKQLRNARASMQVPDDETVLGLLNATFSGDGKEGMLFGTRGIYYHTDFTRRDGPAVAFISYDQLAERTVKNKAVFQVSLDQGQYFVTAKSSMSAQQLVELLERIQAAVKAHHQSALVAAK